MKGSEVLSFPLTKPISRPDLLTSLRVALDWTELDRNRLNLEDQRQHIVTATEKDGRHHVVIEILPTEPVKRSANSLSAATNSHLILPILVLSSRRTNRSARKRVNGPKIAKRRSKQYKR